MSGTAGDDKMMKASRIHEHGGTDQLKFEDAPMPVPGPGEVLIRVVAAGVNPADYKHRSGLFKDRIAYVFPKILGYDVSGVIAAHGPGVTAPPLGARVVAMLNPRVGGGYAQFVATPAEGCAILPDDMDFDTAAAIPCPALTGAQMIAEQACPRPGETVLVTGATGMVGRFAVQTAKRLGANVVAAVRPAYFDEARSLGVVDVVALDGQTWKGQPLDAMADTVGGNSAAMLARGVKPGGKIISVATDRMDTAGLSSTPVFFAVHPDGALLGELISDVAAGVVPVSITARFPLEQAGAAQALVERGGVRGKVILQVS